MRPLVKVGLVGAGYIGAFALASAVVTAYVAATSGPDRQNYGAMFAFGDDLLFLGVFGVAAVVPSGAALFFLRPYRSFWRVLSVTALSSQRRPSRRSSTTSHGEGPTRVPPRTPGRLWLR